MSVTFYTGDNREHIIGITLAKKIFPECFEGQCIQLPNNPDNKDTYVSAEVFQNLIFVLMGASVNSINKNYDINFRHAIIRACLFFKLYDIATQIEK